GGVVAEPDDDLLPNVHGLVEHAQQDAGQAALERSPPDFRMRHVLLSIRDPRTVLTPAPIAPEEHGHDGETCAGKDPLAIVHHPTHDGAHGRESNSAHELVGNAPERPTRPCNSNSSHLNDAPSLR